MAIRICALGVSGFRHDGLEVGERWAPVDPAGLSAAGRSTLRDFHGRFIQVHAEDRDKLPAAFGLAFVDANKPLADLNDKKSTTKTAPKSDAKKEG
jgi:hypothetical protein